jgi:hypothetical protein
MRVVAVAVLIALITVADAGASPPGTFDRMFKQLAPFTAPTEQQIADLAQTMPDPGDATTDHPGFAGRLHVLRPVH